MGDVIKYTNLSHEEPGPRAEVDLPPPGIDCEVPGPWPKADPGLQWADTAEAEWPDSSDRALW